MAKHETARADDKDRNEDPLSGEPGSHPVEVGVGTAGGAAAGAAIGAAAGPPGVIAGAVIGGIAGGLAGKATGEALDPTDPAAEAEYWREHFHDRPYAAPRSSFKQYQPAYEYGRVCSLRSDGRSFDDAEADLAADWKESRGNSRLTWEKAKPAVRDAWDRTIQLKEERLNVDKEEVRAGEVGVRKEVVTDTQTINVPVEREEVVIERRPAGGRAAGPVTGAEEIRIPVKEERVRVRKDTVVNEEVSVGKRKVRGTETVRDTVRKEKLKVDRAGKTNVRESAGKR